MSVAIPYKLFTPVLASLQAERLRSAFPIFERYGIRLGVDSALLRAACLLDEVTECNSFLPPARTRRQVERALSMAVQIPAIAEALPHEPFAQLKRALRVATRGGLENETPRANQAHAELYAGVVFAAGGAQPQMIPVKSGVRSPDYLMQIAGFQFAVEVKRPEVPKTIVSNAHEAAKQGAAYGHQPNVIVLDVTDAISGGSDDRCVPADAYANAVGASRDRCAIAIANQALAGERRFAHVIGLMVIAQAVEWHGENLTQPAVTIFCATQRFPDAYHGLVSSDTQRVFDCFERGTTVLGGDRRGG